MKSDRCFRNPSVRRLAKRFLACLGIALAPAAISPFCLTQEVPARPGATPLVVEDQGQPLRKCEKNIYELRDTFWHLKRLQGADIDTSGMVVNIQFENHSEEIGIITFSTRPYAAALSFVQKPAGIEFSSMRAPGNLAENSGESKDQRAGEIFENELLKTCCYELRDGVLTFEDRNQHPTIVLSAFQQEGIENRRWRIAKYRADGNDATQKGGLNEPKDPADVVFMSGRISGSPGCGGFDGTYKITGDNLTSVAYLDLAGLCYQEQFVQDGLVLAALRGDRQIEKDGGNILLRDQSGRAMLLLVPY